MMHEITTAVVTHYLSAAGAALRALVGQTSTVKKFWEDEAPPNTAGPYITMSIISSGHDGTMGSDIDDMRIQFSVWDDDPNSATAQQVADAVRALYNNVQLTLTNGYTMLCSNPVSPGRKLRDPDDKGFQIIVEIDFLVEKAR